MYSGDRASDCNGSVIAAAPSTTIGEGEVWLLHAIGEDADAALADFAREPLPYAAGFLTGKTCLAHRKRGGTKRSPMTDIYVGAHAVVGSMTLLTRDAARYRTYFPALNIIAPA